MFAVVLVIPFLIVADGLLALCVPIPHRPGGMTYATERI